MISYIILTTVIYVLPKAIVGYKAEGEWQVYKVTTEEQIQYRTILPHSIITDIQNMEI